MAITTSEDPWTVTGDDTDGIVGHPGASQTHRRTASSTEEEARNWKGDGRRQGEGQTNPEQQPTLSQDSQDGNPEGLQAETPTPTPEPTESTEPTESDPNVTPVATSIFGPGDNTTPTPASSSVDTDSTAGISNTGNGGSTGMSGNKKVAIAVPVAIGGAALIAGIILLVLYIQRRRQRKQQQQGRASLLPAANTPMMGPAPAAATMALPSSQAQTQAPPRNIDLSPPFDGSSPPYQPSTDTRLSQDIDANHAAIGVALTPEQQAPPSPSPSPPPSPPPPAVTGVAARNIQSQDIDSHNRAQSPFDDPPLPDTFSDISRVSGRRRDGMGSIRSAVSSIDDEHEARGHDSGPGYGHGHGHGRMSID